MAKLQMKIGYKGVSYVPEEIRREGFIGKVDLFLDASAFAVRKPGVKLRDFLRSLDLIREDVAHRVELGEE